MITSAGVANVLGHIPVVGRVLRWYARQYEEGSVVRIATGDAAGMKWRRHHRYVNGYWTGVYELDMQRAIARELAPGACFYDVGANAGFFSVLAARLVGPGGRVFSFEPLPENAHAIREQIEINSLNQCEVIEEAVSDRTGLACFEPARHNACGHLSNEVETRATANEKELMVQTVTLDEFALDHAVPDLIKIDVEGAEVEVLAGANSLLSAPRAPRLIIELHGEEKARSVGAILASLGYRLKDLSGTGASGRAGSQRHVIGYPPNRGEDV